MAENDEGTLPGAAMHSPVNAIHVVHQAVHQAAHAEKPPGNETCRYASLFTVCIAAGGRESDVIEPLEPLPSHVHATNAVHHQADHAHAHQALHLHHDKPTPPGFSWHKHARCPRCHLQGEIRTSFHHIEGWRLAHRGSQGCTAEETIFCALCGVELSSANTMNSADGKLHYPSGCDLPCVGDGSQPVHHTAQPPALVLPTPSKFARLRSVGVSCDIAIITDNLGTLTLFFAVTSLVLSIAWAAVALTHFDSVSNMCSKLCHSRDPQYANMTVAQRCAVPHASYGDVCAFDGSCCYTPSDDFALCAYISIAMAILVKAVGLLCFRILGDKVPFSVSMVSVIVVWEAQQLFKMAIVGITLWSPALYAMQFNSFVSPVFSYVVLLLLLLSQVCLWLFMRREGVLSLVKGDCSECSRRCCGYFQ